MAKSKVFLIDPTAQTITEAQVDLESLMDIYETISADAIDIVGAWLYHGEKGKFTTCCIIIDDNGGLLEPSEQFTFKIGKGLEGRHLAGKAIVAGDIDSYGKSLPCALSLDDVVSQVSFFGNEKPIKTGFTVVGL